MKGFWRRFRSRRSSHVEAIEHEKTIRLYEAEASLEDLRRRADAAMRVLDERGGRNHWREAIENMIQGA